MSATRSLETGEPQAKWAAARWPTVLLLAVSGMLSSMQFTLVVPSLPSFSEDLGVSAEDASWLVTITLLAGAVGTPVLSRMADMYGRRRLLVVALGLLVAGSLAAALLNLAMVALARGVADAPFGMLVEVMQIADFKLQI